MDRHIVVVSADALLYEDMHELSQLSFFKRMWNRAARVDRIRSIYPTITYPCHATMMTGVYPETHGIINNEQLCIGQISSPWVHMRDAVKAPTIFDHAKAKGLTTASVFWPVTGRDSSIDYLINEYWPQSPEETTRECFIHSGTSPKVMEKIVDPNLGFLQGKERMHPWADQFIMNCATDIIREFKPNLLMIHPANIDGYRHETGLFSPKVTQGLHETNLWMEQLYKATEDAGIAEATDFFIVSDHGQMNISRNIALNVLLKENGLIEVDENGAFINYTAYAKSGGLMALVYLKNPDSKQEYERTYAVLRQLMEAEVYGISRIFTAEEVREEEHLSGGFSFALETDGYTSFSNDWMRPLVRTQNNQDYRYGRATHGHLPSKGPQPTFFAFGPHIRSGVKLAHARLVDEAPTFAAALGIDMGDVDGRCLEELIRR